MTTLNGLGAEEVVRAHGDWPIVSAVTFMSGTKHSDSEVEYVLDTATWMGPYEDTPLERVEEVGDLVRRSGLEAEVLRGPAPRTVVEADLQRDGQLRRRAHRAPPRPPFRRRGGARRPRSPRPRPRRRGEGSRRRGGHRALRGPLGDERPSRRSGAPPTIRRCWRTSNARRPTEIDLITGSLVREAGRHGVPVPLHTALYRLVKAKEESWREPESNGQAHQEA